ncbi:class I SAM-dependent methyltransferase [Chloroflexota bacterium]
MLIKIGWGLIDMKYDKEAYNIKAHEGGCSYGQDWQDYYSSIIELVPPDSYVLDVGCARGGLLEYLREKRNCRVKGLDITSGAVTFCKEKGIEVIKCDVEEEEVPGVYDVVIFSAILEHLINPLSVLEKLKKNLRDDGHIVILVPNYSHILARIQYLLGRNITTFGNTQEDIKYGIQPYGHVRFFNKSTLSHILLKTGYKPIEWSYDKPKSFSANSQFCLPRRMISKVFLELYRLNYPLFSVNLAVKAVKIR